MKKKIAIIILILISIIGLIYKTNLNKEKNINKEMIAIFLEEEKGTGKYQRSSLKNWAFGDEYVINIQKSYCKNGGLLRWNQETKKISAKIKGSDECYVYFDKGEYGTKEHPYLIQTIEDLVRLSNSVNIDGINYSEKYFFLTNDLDFRNKSDYEDANTQEFGDINGINGPEPLIDELTTGNGFKPIGMDGGNYFRGNFDGGNHRIDNLYIFNNSVKYVGLFGIVTLSEISNLTVSGNIKTSIGADLGGLIGWLGSNSQISNCHSEVNIEIGSGNNSLGGIVATVDSKNAKIINCTNKGNITNGYTVGGIVGLTAKSIVIENCINYGNIANNKGLYVGGIVGHDNTTSSETIINNSHNEGVISSSFENERNVYLGGLIGKIIGAVNIDKSYNSGKVMIDTNLTAFSTQHETTLGGIIGNIEGQGVIKNTYNKGDIEKTRTAGGIIGKVLTTTSLIIDACYNSGTINANFALNERYAGGLIGTAGIMEKISDNAKIIILNSYNRGDIDGISPDIQVEYAGGLIGVKTGNFDCKNIILNSYNLGQVTATNYYASGILMNLNPKTIINNVYNAGQLTAPTRKYGIGYFRGTVDTDFEIQNAYYENSVSASNNGNVTGKAMSIKDMKQQTFVDELNKNAENINLEEIDESLKGYSLSKWQLGSDGYPELINN